LIALVLAVQIPSFLYGQSVPLLLLFAAEMSSLLTLLILLVMLRLCLALPSAPRGSNRNALDFVAMMRWHPAVKAALAGLIVLPPAWYIHGDPGFIQLLRILGRRALTSRDFRPGSHCRYMAIGVYGRSTAPFCIAYADSMEAEKSCASLAAGTRGFCRNGHRRSCYRTIMH
jgi:hypothetical protein